MLKRVVVVAAAGVAATGGDTGAGFDGGNMRVEFGERISTGVAIDAGDGDGDGAGAGADTGGGTETDAADGAADTIGLLTGGCTGADGVGFGVALTVGGGARSSKEVSSESLSSSQWSVPLPLSSSSSLLPPSHMRSAMET